MSTTAKIDQGKLILVIDLNDTPYERTKGGAGNNLMVASTSGYQGVGVKIDGKELKVSINAIIKV